VSKRVGAALAEFIRESQAQDEQNFFLIEGVTSTVAEGMVANWDDDALPRLAILPADPKRFGKKYALVDEAATGIRNAAPKRGVVLVLCDGEEIADRQGISGYKDLSPSDMLEKPIGLMLLCQQKPQVDPDGVMGAVRKAVLRADVTTRPTATAFAAYLDEVAAGADPLTALPTLGAFADRQPPDENFSAERILENLSLSARRTSEDFMQQRAYADIRRRADRVLRGRPTLKANQVALLEAVDSVMASIQTGSSKLLSQLLYDEAREIFEKRTESLTAVVQREMSTYRSGLEIGSEAEGLPWDLYEQRATELRSGPLQKPAAKQLLGLDEAQQSEVFTESTRLKLQRLLADKSIDGSKPSCPEAALVQAMLQLGSDKIQRVQVLDPSMPSINTAAATNRSGAGKILTMACARLRLGGLMKRLKKQGTTVDGQLLRAANDSKDLGDVFAAFGDAGLAEGASLPHLVLRLHSDEGYTWEVKWRPDLDDVALLKAALLFSRDAAKLTLSASFEPTLRVFCGPTDVDGIHPNSTLLSSLAKKLHSTAADALDSGLTPKLMKDWVSAWTEAAAKCEKSGGDGNAAQSIALAGGVLYEGQAAALTGFSPPKAEWLGQQLEALWELVERSGPCKEMLTQDLGMAAQGVARATATNHPAHLRLRLRDRPLPPSSEGRIWGLYGGSTTRDDSGFANDVFESVVKELLKLQPEAAGHFRCLAWGPGAADLVIQEAVKLVSTKVGLTIVKKVEVFCVGNTEESRPTWNTLADADKRLRGERDVLQIRYADDLAALRSILKPANGWPAVHMALVTGLSGDGDQLQIDNPDVQTPAINEDVLFTPRVWQRPGEERRTLLMPPTASDCGQAWLRLQNGIDGRWPTDDRPLRVPEVWIGTSNMRLQLEQVHDLAMWVATLDRYVTRESLENALGAGEVAILHQERRLSGDSPLSLVISQKTGGPVDHAIARSLALAGIVSEADVALSLGADLRKVASQGYGILALKAATSGAGINELVGHVVAFSLLATQATPWPLPPDCRVILVSLDEYQYWFGAGKRADLLAIALDTRECGVHVAAIEVKARRSDEANAAAGALEQLNATVSATRFAAQPEPGDINSRLWLNRIADAAYAVARESQLRLDEGELQALEAFRLGHGSLEWAGVGLVFGPKVKSFEQIQHKPLGNDLVSISLHGITLTEDLLRSATSTDLATLRTVQTEKPTPASTRVKRRPESKAAAVEESEDRVVEKPSEFDSASDIDDGSNAGDSRPGSDSASFSEVSKSIDRQGERVDTNDDRRMDYELQPFTPPVLGWDVETGEAVLWKAAGSGADVLQNGHVEIWGSSGMGKTQFVMPLMAQLAKTHSSHFGIADFKNDYGDSSGFPRFANAQFLDLWDEGAPYNPLALAERTDKAIGATVIELRDTIEEAAKSFTRMGVRQKAKLEAALRAAYSESATEHRWPTLLSLNHHLDEDLAGVMGDLTRNELFKAGVPLGDVIDRNVVFGLFKIPGNGQTTILAAGFILSALLLRIQNLTPVSNRIRYVVVVDEAHRVVDFKAIKRMIKEGRSQGLAVVLATQEPLDMQGVVGANAQTRICFGLPDAGEATKAARKMQPDNARLAKQIRTLKAGHAYVSLGGAAPRLLRMAQGYRDWDELGLPRLQRDD
jgi:hypothetical protein